MRIYADWISVSCALRVGIKARQINDEQSGRLGRVQDDGYSNNRGVIRIPQSQDKAVAGEFPRRDYRVGRLSLVHGMFAGD